jgi:hypothetical protein
MLYLKKPVYDISIKIFSCKRPFRIKYNEIMQMFQRQVITNKISGLELNLQYGIFFSLKHRK